MSSLNKVMIIGRVGKDPETRYSAGGDAITNLSVATSESWKDKGTGEKVEKTEWHRVSMFGKLAEIAAKYLAKGSLVYIEGKLTTRKWTDKDGQDRYTTEIRADQMTMLGGKSDSDAAPQQKPAAKPAADDSFDDDIPF